MVPGKPGLQPLVPPPGLRLSGHWLWVPSRAETLQFLGPHGPDEGGPVRSGRARRHLQADSPGPLEVR